MALISSDGHVLAIDIFEVHSYFSYRKMIALESPYTFLVSVLLTSILLRGKPYEETLKIFFQ